MTTPGGGSVGGGGDLGSVRGKIIIDASEAEKGAEKAASAVEGFEKKSGASNKRMNTDAKQFAQAYGVAVAGGIALAVTAAANFEQALANVAAAGGKDAANQMDQVRDKALQLGADTKFSATEAAGAMEVLIKAGLSVSDVLGGAADAAVNLAAAEGITIPEAAEIAAVAMTAFNMKASDMPAIANKISQAASATKMDVNDFSHAMNQAGAVSKLVGLGFDDMTLAIVAMGKAGIVGSDAGTSLKTMLMNLQPSTKAARNAMHDLGIMTEDGSNRFFDATGNIKSMTEISEILYQATKKLTPAQRQQALETIFGSDAIRAAAIISEQGAAGMNKLTGEMNNQLSVAEKAKVKQDTLQGALEKMKGSVETAAIKFGTVFIPVLKGIAGWLEKVADWFANLPKPVKEAMAWAVIITGGLVALGLAVGAVAKAVNGFIAVLNVLRVVMMAHPILLIATIIAALVAVIIANWDKVSAALVASWNFLKGVAITVWTAISDFFTTIFTGIKDFFVGIWTAIGDFFEWIATKMVQETATQFGETIWETISRWFTNVRDFIVEIWTGIKNWLFGIFTEIVTWILNTAKDFAMWFVRVWVSIKDGAIETLRDFLNWLGDLPGNILSALGDFGSLLLNLGRDLLQGLWDGIKNALGWLRDKISSIGGSILGWIGDRLGISSPSKYTFEFGEFLTIGLGKGVESKLGMLRQTLDNAGSIIEPTLRPYLSPSATATGNPVGVMDRPISALATTTPTGVQAAGGGATYIDKIEIPVRTIIDPTNPVEWRNMMKAIRDGINQVEKEYGGT